MFALPAPPFVFGTGIDTNSTLTPTGSHRAHGRLAFQIVKERCSSRRWTLCPRNQGRTLLRNRNRQVVLGGAGRDRTDDLLLAKQALSQLSYGPYPDASTPLKPPGPATALDDEAIWWAWEDLNFRPHAYQARALTN